MPYYRNAEVIASHAQERCSINGLYAHAICFVFIISNDRDVGRTELLVPDFRANGPSASYFKLIREAKVYNRLDAYMVNARFVRWLQVESKIELYLLLENF
jgi:hypothetical protein